jgi:RHS repeat-associated protein
MGLVSDALGSTVALTDNAGAVQTSYTYEPFGATAVTGTATPNVWDYTGRESDPTGLKYYRARYYDPVRQRFINEDPIGLAGGANVFGYAANSPINFSDALGLYVTVIQYKGRPGNPFGHIGIAVNSSATLGFYGDDSLAMLAGDPVPGHIASDFGHQVEKVITLDTTIEQERAILDFIIKRIEHPGSYTMGGRNCGSFVAEALEAGGLETSGSPFPRSLMQDIIQRHRSTLLPRRR